MTLNQTIIRAYLSFGGRCEAALEFHRTAPGAQAEVPFCNTFWSPCFGMLTDRFGVGWRVTVAP
jgi:PhnB protein